MSSVSVEQLECGGIVLNLVTYRVSRDGVPVRLGFTDLTILRCLISEPGRVFSREDLLAAVWRGKKVASSRVIDGHIVQLRRALNRPGHLDAICTVPFAGYKLGVSTGQE